MVFDAIGGDILERSTELVRPGGTLVTIAMPPTVQPTKSHKSHESHKHTLTGVAPVILEVRHAS